MTDCVCFETIDNECSEMCVFVQNYVHMVQCDQAPGAHLVLTPHSVPPASSHTHRQDHNCGWLIKKKVLKQFTNSSQISIRLAVILYAVKVCVFFSEP